MSVNVKNLFPANESWEDFLKKIQLMDPLPKDQLQGFLEFILTESRKKFPDPQIIAGAAIILEKSRFTCDDILEAGVQYTQALDVLTRKYGLLLLNSTLARNNPEKPNATSLTCHTGIKTVITEPGVP